jgi:uncharacterized protein with GYD domain
LSAGVQHCPPAARHAVEDGPIARYVVLFDWTDQGARTAIKETVQRVAQARTAWEPLGVRLEAVYWTLGDHDLVAIIDAPDDGTIAAALLQVASAGNIRTKTLRAFDEGEVQALLGKLG